MTKKIQDDFCFSLQIKFLPIKAVNFNVFNFARVIVLVLCVLISPCTRDFPAALLRS